MDQKALGRKLGYTVVFAYSRRGALREEASIHTAELTAMKEIKEREDVRWVIYTDLLNSMPAIKINRDNYPILKLYLWHKIPNVSYLFVFYVISL